MAQHSLINCPFREGNENLLTVLRDLARHQVPYIVTPDLRGEGVTYYNEHALIAALEHWPLTIFVKRLIYPPGTVNHYDYANIVIPITADTGVIDIAYLASGTPRTMRQQGGFNFALDDHCSFVCPAKVNANIVTNVCGLLPECRCANNPFLVRVAIYTEFYAQHCDALTSIDPLFNPLPTYSAEISVPKIVSASQCAHYEALLRRFDSIPKTNMETLSAYRMANGVAGAPSLYELYLACFGMERGIILYWFKLNRVGVTGTLHCFCDYLSSLFGMSATRIRRMLNEMWSTDLLLQDDDSHYKLADDSLVYRYLLLFAGAYFPNETPSSVTDEGHYLVLK